MTDPLQEMLDAQQALQSRLSRLRNERGVLAVQDNAVMLMMEAAEVLNATPWKKHKSDYGRVLTAEEWAHVREEAIDCLHFVLNLLLLCGDRTSREVLVHFREKNKVNHERQDKGY